MERIKKTDSSTVAFRIPRTTRDQWKAEADKLEISMSDYIWRLIEKNGQGTLMPSTKTKLMKLYNDFVQADYENLGATASNDKRVLKKALNELYEKNTKVIQSYMDLMENVVGLDFYDPNIEDETLVSR